MSVKFKVITKCYFLINFGIYNNIEIHSLYLLF